MTNQLLKKKAIIIPILLIGILFFSVCHASVMHQSMDKMDCYAQSYCGACPVPVAPDSPGLNNFLIHFEILSENPFLLPDPLKDTFYHPPR